MDRHAFDGLIAPWKSECTALADDLYAGLVAFHDLLQKWQNAQNLVSRETLDHFWIRHIADSLQVLPILPGDAPLVFDLGSGGGFPALPLAIALKGSGAQFHLIEANSRKVAFLRTVIRELGLNARVHNVRIETFDSRETGQADVVLARALAPLDRLCGYGFLLLQPEGALIVHKGRENGVERDAAGANWLFDVVIHPSVTDNQGVLLDIRRLRPRA